MAKFDRFRVILNTNYGYMNGKAVHDTPAIQSLDRGLVILEAVAASVRPVPLRQLTDLIGIDRSSVFRLANTLRQRRFLAHAGALAPANLQAEAGTRAAFQA